MRISDWSSDVCSSDLVFVLPFVPTGPEGAASRLARFRGREEQIQEILFGWHGIASNLEDLGVGIALAVARTGADQHQLADQLGIAVREALRYEAADREAEPIDLIEDTRLDDARAAVARTSVGEGNRGAG